MKQAALLSAYDKTGLEDFAASLLTLGFDLYGSEGTVKYLKDHGIDHQPIKPQEEEGVGAYAVVKNLGGCVALSPQRPKGECQLLDIFGMHGNIQVAGQPLR